MNKKDAQRTEKLSHLMYNIPNPVDDWRQTQTSTVRFNHSKAMVLFAFWLKNYTTNLLLEHHWKKHPENGDVWVFEDEYPDWIDPDVMLNILEQWVGDLQKDRYQNDLPMRELSTPDK